MCRKRLHFYRTFHISKPFWNLESVLSLLATLGEGCADMDVSVFQMRKHMSNITHLFQADTGRQWQGCSCNLGLLALSLTALPYRARLSGITESSSACSFVLLMLFVNYFQTQGIFSERNYSSCVQ